MIVELLLVVIVLVLGACLLFVWGRLNDARSQFEALQERHQQLCYLVNLDADVKGQALRSAKEYLGLSEGDDATDA